MSKTFWCDFSVHSVYSTKTYFTKISGNLGLLNCYGAAPWIGLLGLLQILPISLIFLPVICVPCPIEAIVFSLCHVNLYVLLLLLLLLRLLGRFMAVASQRRILSAAVNRHDIISAVWTSLEIVMLDFVFY